MERLKALLRLNACHGCGVRVLEKLESRATPPEALFGLDGPSLQAEVGLSEDARAFLSKLVRKGWAEEELDRCARLNVDVICCDDAHYPKSLWDLADPPIALYIRGSRRPGAPAAVGVVGTRRPSAYALKTARKIGMGCAHRLWDLVSGGALGIDGAAHRGVLDIQGGEGATFAVLGTGVDRVFPAEHRGLFEEIRERGALVSEYPLGAGGEAWRFPRRNRIIAALCRRLVVVEAPTKSGALITARMALEMDREIWAIPGRIDEACCRGSNRLLFDGALPLIDLDDFFELYAGQRSLFEGEKISLYAQEAGGVSLSESERVLLEFLRLQSGRTVDNLSDGCKMSAAEVLKALAILSANGLVYSSGPGRYAAS